MIFKKKPNPEIGDTRTKIRFAFFPIRLKSCEIAKDANYDYVVTTGDLLWLEKYVITERFNYRNEWKILEVISYNQNFIDKLTE